MPEETKHPSSPTLTSRAVVCSYCGKAWDYNGVSPKDELVKEAVDHEAVCDKNPYTARIKELEDERLRMKKALRHCRLFIVDRKGYINNEALERELIKQEIDALLTQNS